MSRISSQVERYEEYIRNTYVKRRSMSLSKEMETHILYEEEIIKRFLSQSDTPRWHRGISQFQSDAAARLLNALRDDAEQRTSHRVRACMLHIGLNPVINAKETKFLMRLSRCNDLAFLWFLMELHYKSDDEDYNLNEQLIMSTIASLDIVTTLRELDRILPPGHPSIKVLERQKRLQLEKEQLEEEAKKKRQKPKHKLPYFNDLERPVHYGKSLFIKEPDFKVSLGTYDKYKNPRHIVANEFNRWYADYDLSPSKRIVNRIINDEIVNIFADYAKATKKGETLKPLCERHKIIQELEESLKHKLKVAARDQCLRMLDTDGGLKEASRKRMMTQLEQEIGAYVCKFHKIADEVKRHCTVKILLNECTGCDIKLVDEHSTESAEDEPCAPPTPPGLEEEHRASIDVNRDFRRESGGNIFMLSEKNMPTCPPQKSVSCDARMEGKNDDDIGLDISPTSSAASHGSAPAKLLDKEHISFYKDVPRASSSCHFKSSKSLHDYDSEKGVSTTSEIYFEAPTANKPYQFDYPKIFRFKDSAEKLNMRKVFAEAVDSDDQLPEKHLTTKPNLTKAVHKCAAKIWREQVELKNIELEAAAEHERLNAREDPNNPLKFEAKIYDPNDKPLMLKMLREALEYMSQNPKYVLASMPEAYKLPVLGEFIMKRYGKGYSREERVKSFLFSLKIFHALDNIHTEEEMPKSSELGKNLFLDYSCHDYLLKKAEYIKKNFYKRLNATTMDQARTFWYAMKPYLCSGGPPRGTYYAYMPAGTTDIKRFRIWKPTEFIDFKSAWDQRMRNQKN